MICNYACHLTSKCSNRAVRHLPFLTLFYTVQSLGVLLTECNKQTVKNTNLIILAVKPNIIKSVLKELSPYLTKNHIVLSIAAGVNLRTLEKVRLYFNVLISVVFSFFAVFKYYSNKKQNILSLSCPSADTYSTLIDHSSKSFFDQYSLKKNLIPVCRRVKSTLPIVLIYVIYSYLQLQHCRVSFKFINETLGLFSFSSR